VTKGQIVIPAHPWNKLGINLRFRPLVCSIQDKIILKGLTLPDIKEGDEGALERG
jgi:bifunctional DNA-binding transcriptional regulator/antitoxin component of YhaV-PrlF toxin-antitoxin module